MRVLILAAGLLAMNGAGAANAAPITLAYDFLASGFQVIGAGVAPVDPVRGSFNLTFDPAQPIQSPTAGLTVTGLNIAYDGATEYGFTGVFNELVIGTDVIYPGGHSVAGEVDPLADDLALYLALDPTLQAGLFTYSQAAGAYYTTEDVVLTPAVVPEPASLALLGGALLSLAWSVTGARARCPLRDSDMDGLEACQAAKQPLVDHHGNAAAASAQ